MPERTSPTDAIERLSWILNYVDDGSQSLNSLAEQTDLSWATVQKYTRTIEMVQKVAPRITMESEGVKIGFKSPTMEDLNKDPVTALTVYLFTQAEMRGDAGEPVDIALFDGLSGEFRQALEEAIELGWISEMEEEEKVQLTPTGMRVAGPARSEVENTSPVLEENELHIHQQGAEEVITLADEASGIQEKQTQPDEEYASGGYEEDHESERFDRSRYPAAA